MPLCGDDGCGEAHGAPTTAGEIWLSKQIDTSQVRCYNELHSGSARSVFKSYHHRLSPTPVLSSTPDEDDDEADALLIVVPFLGTARLRSVCVIPGGSGSEENIPRSIKIYPDQPNLSLQMEELNRVRPGFEAALGADFQGELDYPLPPSKFGSVSSVTILLRGPVPGGQIHVGCIGFKGIAATGQYRPVVAAYEATAQLKDHAKAESTLPKSLA